MKIALINKVFSLGYGGGERYGVNLARALCQKGIEVHLIGTVFEDVPSEAIIHRVYAPKGPAFRRITEFVSNTRSVVSSNDFDIVYSLTQYYPSNVFRVGGGVYKYWMNLRFPGVLPRLFRYLINPVHLAHLYLESRMYCSENYKAIIANSFLCKGHVLSYYQVPEERIEVIHNGVDRSIFNLKVRELYRKSQRNVLGLSDADVAILFVSNNWKRKGIDMILQALHLSEKNAGHFKLIILGKGKKQRFMKKAKEFAIDCQVSFLEHSREIERYYAAADIFVLPTQYDPFSNTCIEAMACGLPVITTAYNGASEVISHKKTGFILEKKGNVKTLTFYLTSLIDKELREDMGQKAAQSARILTVDQNMENTLKVFYKIMENTDKK